MPKWLNNYGLPAPLFHSLTWESYSKGNADISVTELLKSPRQRLLTKRHDAEIEVDASENMWALMGRAVHSVLRSSAGRVGKNGFDGMAEERLFVKVDGPKGPWMVSGEFDLLYNNNGTLTLADYKVMSVWAYIFERENGGVKQEHSNQINIYRWMLAEHGFDVKSLEIAMIFRDWKNSDAAKAVNEGKTDYPQCPILVVPVPMWSVHEVKEFVKDRVAIHQQAESLKDDRLPECTADERWKRGDQYAVFKGASKRAFRVFSDELEAKACSDEIGGTIEYRPGKSQKCSLYCWGKKWCNQHQSELAAEICLK